MSSPLLQTFLSLWTGCFPVPVPEFASHVARRNSRRILGVGPGSLGRDEENRLLIRGGRAVWHKLSQLPAVCCRLVWRPFSQLPARLVRRPLHFKPPTRICIALIGVPALPPAATTR